MKYKRFIGSVYFKNRDDIWLCIDFDCADSELVMGCVRSFIYGLIGGCNDGFYSKKSKNYYYKIKEVERESVYTKIQAT